MNHGPRRALTVVTMPAIQERPKIDELRSALPICVLDDEADHVELATTYLKQAGFPAHGTTSPAEALEKVRGGECRVVIADFKMPGMDGMTFLEKALQSDPWNVRDPGDRILFGGFGD
jgi:CheY-like chemotaxis protein